MVAKPSKARKREKIPRLVLDLSDAQKIAFREVCDAKYPGANATFSHVLRKLIEEACTQYKIRWPE
jgi:hypothetical protein